MNFEKATKILELQKDFNDRMLKKKYVERCLLYHPDKNPDCGDEHFIEIKEAYEFLKDNENKKSFKKETQYNENTFENIVSSLYTLVVDNYQNVSIKLFTKLDKNKSIELYEFIVKYQYIFKVSDELIKEMEINLREKLKDDNIFFINLSLCDIVDNNIYILKYNEEETYYIPLWHNEIVFDEKVRVKCIRELPEHISIDEYNNIHYYDKQNVSDLLHREKITISIANLEVEIKVNQLKIQKYQKIELKERGISKVNKNDKYDISKKGHIYYYLELC